MKRRSALREPILLTSIAVGAALGCTGARRTMSGPSLTLGAPPSQDRAEPATPVGVDRSPSARLTARDVTRLTLQCALGPIVWDVPETPTARFASPSETEACREVATDGLLSSAAVYDLDLDATRALRALLVRRLAIEQPSATAEADELAFFDAGLRAAREARSAHLAIDAHKRGLSDPPVDRLADSHALEALASLGRTSETEPVAADASALAWLLGVDRWLDARGLPERALPYAALPLERLLAGSATTSPDGRAMGGGPSGSPPTVESRTLVSSAAQRRLSELEPRVHDPALREALRDSSARVQRMGAQP